MPVRRSTKEDYVEIFRRVLPAEYVAPLKDADGGIGEDLAYALAAMFELADCASNKGTQAYFLRPHSAQTDEPAKGAQKAAGKLQLRRTAPTTGSVQIPIGTVLEAYRTDSYGGNDFVGRYVVTDALTVTEGTAGPMELPIEAESVGYFGNIATNACRFRFAPLGSAEIPCVVAMSGSVPVLRRTVAPQEDRYVDAWTSGFEGRHVVFEPRLGELFVADPMAARRITAISGSDATVSPNLTSADAGKACLARVVELSELGLTLEQPTAIAGGNGGMLDARAAEYVAPRRKGESDEILGNRLEAIDDTGSPPAIWRAVDAILSPLGIAWKLLEVGNAAELRGFIWDVSPWDWGSLQNGGYWLSRAQSTRLFVIAVSTKITTEPGAAARVWREVNSKRGYGVVFKFIADPTI